MSKNRQLVRSVAFTLQNVSALAPSVHGFRCVQLCTMPQISLLYGAL